MKKRTYIILINIGSPQTASKHHVKTYLKQFLNDKYVVNIHPILRFLLVNLIIIPFRLSKSTRLYEKIYSEKGFPLIHYSKLLQEKLQNILGNEYVIISTNRYGHNNISKVLESIDENEIQEIIFVPMYPQYAQSTTLSAIVSCEKSISKWKTNVKYTFVKQFYNNPAFIEAQLINIRKYDIEKYDYVLFTFHGLPLSHIQKNHNLVDVNNCECITEMPPHGKFCYKATCYETARIIASRLNLSQKKYSIAFQSRIGKKWITPFADKVVADLPKSGVKKILVISPSFVTDCLETIHEIEIEYKAIFKQNGGGELVLVKALNDNDYWAEALVKIIGLKE